MKKIFPRIECDRHITAVKNEVHYLDLTGARMRLRLKAFFSYGGLDRGQIPEEILQNGYASPTQAEGIYLKKV